METVFDALKAMGKATSVELAARLDISREEVLNELWDEPPRKSWRLNSLRKR